MRFTYDLNVGILGHKTKMKDSPDDCYMQRKLRITAPGDAVSFLLGSPHCLAELLALVGSP